MLLVAVNCTLHSGQAGPPTLESRDELGGSRFEVRELSDARLKLHTVTTCFGNVLERVPLHKRKSVRTEFVANDVLVVLGVYLIEL